jgi:hypothetical protein
MGRVGRRSCSGDAVCACACACVRAVRVRVCVCVRVRARAVRVRECARACACACVRARACSCREGLQIRDDGPNAPPFPPLLPALGPPRAFPVQIAGRPGNKSTPPAGRESPVGPMPARGGKVARRALPEPGGGGGAGRPRPPARPGPDGALRAGPGRACGRQVSTSRRYMRHCSVIHAAWLPELVPALYRRRAPAAAAAAAALAPPGPPAPP